MRLALSAVSFAIVVAGVLAVTGSVAAHGGDTSTCSDVEFLGVHVHGDHVIRDYVKGPDGEVGHGEGVFIRGGPGPGFHFPNGFAPGASFCNPQSQSPGFHVPE